MNRRHRDETGLPEPLSNTGRKKEKIMLAPYRRTGNLLGPSRGMERFMDRFFGPGWSGFLEEDDELTGRYPVDIREDDGKLLVEAEMPGFRREEIDVNIHNGVLSITAERKPKETEGKKHLTERRYTRVNRSFTLPKAVDESKVKAKLEEGILHVEIPQTEESKAKKIEVK
jgi:HSP20 family protein